MSTPMAEAFPVGEILADELEERGWTQGEFAEIIGRPTQFVSEIISGKKEITRDSAREIAAALDQSPTYWLNCRTAITFGDMLKTAPQKMSSMTFACERSSATLHPSACYDSVGFSEAALSRSKPPR